MRQAANSQASQPQAGSAEARRAADRLKEARDSVSGMRQQESGQELKNLRSRPTIWHDSSEFVDKLKKPSENPELEGRHDARTGRQQRRAAAREKEQMLNDLNRLERDMQTAARNMAGTQRSASSKVREALGEMQQNELKLRMKFGADWLRRGLGGYVGSRENP